MTVERDREKGIEIHREREIVDVRGGGEPRASPGHRDSSKSSKLRHIGGAASGPINLIMASLFFSTPVDIDVVLEDLDERQTVDVKLDKGRRERVPLYMDGESVKGAVTIRPKDGKRLEHTGIKVQFIGTIGT